MRRGLVTAIVTGVVCLVGFVGVAYSYGDTVMSWTFSNESGYMAQLEFSVDGGRHVWPGGGEAFNMPAGETKTTTLNCFQGQKICYGGWVRGNDSRYWGVGNNFSHNCKGCCFVCGETDPKLTLEE
jgi:hypothetical protein